MFSHVTVMKTTYFSITLINVKNFSAIGLYNFSVGHPHARKVQKRVPWRPFFKKLTKIFHIAIYKYHYETKKIENDSYHFLFSWLCPSLSPVLYFSFDAVCHPTQVGFIQDIAKCCYLQKRIHWGKICHYRRIFRLWILISKISSQTNKRRPKEADFQTSPR